jgi:glycyl-tRNA synthetase beta chain
LIRGPASSGAGSKAGPRVKPGVTKEELADLAEQAAKLCKADLVTEMVGEFPELQGVMGGYYARAEGLPDAVADAIRDHYKPVGQGDEVPTAPVTVAVSLADKLDTLISFFGIKEQPTGSKDPFALRRASLSIIGLLEANRLRLNLRRAVARVLESSAWAESEHSDKVWQKAYLSVEVARFFADRLKVQQREAGVRHDLIDAVFALGNEDDLVRLLSRVNALQNFIATEDGANLLAAYKRAANILKKENWPAPTLVTPAKAGAQCGAADAGLDSRLRGNDEGGEGNDESGGAEGAEGIPRTGEEDPLALVDDPDLKPVIEAKLAEKKKKELSYTPEPAERELIEALDSAEPKAAAAVQAEDFEAAMAALASLRAPIDRFFDDVTVNDSDPAKRSARLDLLGRFRAAVHEVADFSRIEG